MENFDRENIDELLKIRQICQYFPHQNFALYGISLIIIVTVYMKTVLIGTFSTYYKKKWFEVFKLLWLCCAGL